MEAYQLLCEYRRYLIKSRTHESGRRIYDVYDEGGETVLQRACESVDVAMTAVDVEIMWKKWMALREGEASE